MSTERCFFLIWPVSTEYGFFKNIFSFCPVSTERIFYSEGWVRVRVSIRVAVMVSTKRLFAVLASEYGKF